MLLSGWSSIWLAMVTAKSSGWVEVEVPFPTNKLPFDLAVSADYCSKHSEKHFDS